MRKKLKHKQHMPVQTKQLIDAINKSISERDSICVTSHNLRGAVFVVLLSALSFSVFLNILAYT